MVGNRWASRGNLPFKSDTAMESTEGLEFAVVEPPAIAMDAIRISARATKSFRTPIMHMRLRAEFVEDDENGACGSARQSRWELERSASSRARSRGRPRRRTKLFADVTVTDLQPVSVRASRLALAGALRTLVINAATLGGAPA